MVGLRWGLAWSSFRFGVLVENSIKLMTIFFHGRNADSGDTKEVGGGDGALVGDSTEYPVAEDPESRDSETTGFIDTPFAERIVELGIGFGPQRVCRCCDNGSLGCLRPRS